MPDAHAVMPYVQATYCYATSFVPGKMLAVGGNTGNVLYDVSSVPSVASGRILAVLTDP